MVTCILNEFIYIGKALEVHVQVEKVPFMGTNILTVLFVSSMCTCYVNKVMILCTVCIDL